MQVTTAGGERPVGYGGVRLVCVERTGESTLDCANLETVSLGLERVSWFVSSCPRCSFSLQPLLTKLLLCCRGQSTCIWRTHTADIPPRPLLSVRSCSILVMRSYPWRGSRCMIILDLETCLSSASTSGHFNEDICTFLWLLSRQRSG
jgi:hypothetical protein